MRRFIHILLSLWLIFSINFYSFGQNDKRTVSKEKIEQLQNDSDFSYAANYQVEDDPLARIWNWIISSILRIIGSAAQGGPWRIVFLIIIGLVIAYAVVKILGIDPTFGMFYKNRKNNFQKNKGAIIEDISGTDFEAAIKKAYANENYKEVVRYYYLFALNKLDEAEIIRWKKGKTNYEYLYEVQDSAMRENFSSLNYYFEYAIYGEFEVTEVLARSSASLFDKINQSIK